MTPEEERAVAGWLGSPENYPTWTEAGVPSHCGEQMRILHGSRVGWNDEHELHNVEWFCRCGASVGIAARMHVGPPAGLPGER